MAVSAIDKSGMKSPESAYLSDLPHLRVKYYDYCTDLYSGNTEFCLPETPRLIDPLRVLEAITYNKLLCQ